MGQGKKVVNKIFDALTIALGTTVRSVIIPLDKWKAEGFASLDVKALTDDGTVKLTYELSNDETDADGNITFITPSSAIDIVTAHTKTTGPAGDGKEFYAFTPEIAKFLRIVAEETGGGDPVVLTAILLIQ